MTWCTGLPFIISIDNTFKLMHNSKHMNFLKSNFRRSISIALCFIVITMMSCNSGNNTAGTKSDSTAVSSDDKTLLGAGSTFVYPLFSKLFSEYNKINGLKVNYQSIGSGGGILHL